MNPARQPKPALPIAIFTALLAAAPAFGNSGIGLFSRPPMMAQSYEIAVFVVEAFLLTRWFGVPRGRAIAGSLVANATSCLLGMAVAFATLAPEMNHPEKYPGAQVHYYWAVMPWMILVTLAVEMPLVAVICRLRWNLRFVGLYLAMEAITWGAGVAVFYPFQPAQFALSPLASASRSPVARVRADMRSLATSIESYCVDNNSYPRAVPMVPARRARSGAYLTTLAPDPMRIYVRSALPSDVFAERRRQTGPASYDESSSESISFAYHRDACGWILVSPGPDGLYDIDPATDYSSTDPLALLRLSPKTYDPTNGLDSGGDVFRIRP